MLDHVPSGSPPRERNGGASFRAKEVTRRRLLAGLVASPALIGASAYACGGTLTGEPLRIGEVTTESLLLLPLPLDEWRFEVIGDRVIMATHSIGGFLNWTVVL
jgi:hypothetical protein